MVKNNSISEENTAVIEQELAWFEAVLNTRLELYFGHDCAYQSIWEVPAPDHSQSESFYADFIKRNNSNAAERLVLMLLLAPHARPQMLDVFSVKNSTYDKGFTEFGGLKGSSHGGFLPTAETAVFLAAGDDLQQRVHATGLFSNTHYFAGQQIIRLNQSNDYEPFLSSAITLSPKYVTGFLTGEHNNGGFNNDFPAKLITTEIEWADLVLPSETMIQVEEIKDWIDHHHTLMNDWGFSKKMKPGYKCLFYGPPGTGKTLAACLIGKLSELDVYRIDLSLIVSKYIGETEKNLEKIFQMAEHKNWILFFDEADALFGKRTGINNSHDRYANQETAYLLQRIEDFNGVVILASNLRNNMDEAFSRRFQSVIYFPMPQPTERLRLWSQSFSMATQLEEGMNLQALAQRYELTGGTIMNVVRYCSLMALKRKDTIIRLHDAERGIQKELTKEGRMV